MYLPAASVEAADSSQMHIRMMIAAMYLRTEANCENLHVAVNCKKLNQCQCQCC